MTPTIRQTTLSDDTGGDENNIFHMLSSRDATSAPDESGNRSAMTPNKTA